MQYTTLYKLVNTLEHTGEKNNKKLVKKEINQKKNAFFFKLLF